MRIQPSKFFSYYVTRGNTTFYIKHNKVGSSSNRASTDKIVGQIDVINDVGPMESSKDANEGENEEGDKERGKDGR